VFRECHTKKTILHKQLKAMPRRTPAHNRIATRAIASEHIQQRNRSRTNDPKHTLGQLGRILEEMPPASASQTKKVGGSLAETTGKFGGSREESGTPKFARGAPLLLEASREVTRAATRTNINIGFRVSRMGGRQPDLVDYASVRRRASRATTLTRRGPAQVLLLALILAVVWLLLLLWWWLL